MRKVIFGSGLCFLIALASVSAEQSWEKKPYKAWTPEETLQVLSGSPWVQLMWERDPIRSEPMNSYSAVLRLRSALPIREALVRQRMIQVNYDRLSPADQTRFDAEVAEFLKCRECESHYLVTLGSSKPQFAGTGFFDIVWGLRNMTTDELKPFVHPSNDKGEERSLVRFAPPKSEGAEAMFVFNRFDDQGKPLIEPANKNLYFKIDEKAFEKKSVALKRFNFEVSNLTRNGKVVF